MLATGLALAALAVPQVAPPPSPTPTVARTPIAADADEPIGIPAGYKLVWSDEFDRDGPPDPKKWRYDTSRNREGWYNDEQQYYAADRPENVRVEHGALILTARAERLSDRPDYGGQAYSSGKLVTKGLAEWRHAYVEVRAKLACGKGMWPAIWMLGSEDQWGWPGQGEIDIMEMVGWDPQTIHGTIHTKANNHAAGTQIGAVTKLADTCGSFHSYQLDWTADRIMIGVDGHGYMRFANDHSGDHDRWPFDGPQYLLLNVAVGGWGAQQGIDPAAFPSAMTVDYVRVYQRR